MLLPRRNSNAAVAVRFPVEWKSRIYGAALVLAVFLVYLPALRSGFIWDDNDHLTQNPCIVGPLGFAGIWTTSAATYYPLVLSTFWVEHALWGLNPLPYHLVNILMHAMCGVLLWVALRELRVPGAWLGAAIWALHPVQAETVAWVTELKNTQSCFFYLLSILSFIRWRKIKLVPRARRDARYYVLALAFGLSAILSKTSTVMLPEVLGLCWCWLDGRWKWRNTVWLIPFLLISAAAGLWTIWEQRFHSAALGVRWDQGFAQRIIIAGRAVWFYLGKLIWPHPLIFIYPHWNIDASRAGEYLPAVAVMALLAGLWLQRRRLGTAPLFASTYFLVSLFPVMGFFSVYFFRYSFVADHFQYLASMGPAALIGAGLARGIDYSKRLWLGLAPVLLLVVLGSLTWGQCSKYVSNLTLWRSTIAQNPACEMAHSNLGLEYQERGDLDAAAGEYRKALDINPASSEAFTNLGNVYLQRNQVGDAVGLYNKALAVDPGYPDAHLDLGNALLRQGRADAAMAQFKTALTLKPANDAAFVDMGNAYLQSGRADEAISEYNRALDMNPRHAEAYNNLADALTKEGRFDEAMASYQKALSINPGYAEAYYNLGNALLQQGQADNAAAQFREAIRINPGYAAAHNNLGNALLQQGRVDDAIAEYRESVAQDPRFAEAHFNLGNTLRKKGGWEEVISELEKAISIRPRYPDACNNLAYVMATCPVAALRDGARAEALALQANQITGGGNPIVLGTLAACYAEEGRFAEAQKIVAHASELARAQGDTALVALFQQHLALYQAGKPLISN